MHNCFYQVFECYNCTYHLSVSLDHSIFLDPSTPSHAHTHMRPYPSFSYAPPSHSATYLELGDGQVMETLQKHLTQWKSQKERDGGGRREETAGTNVVLFRGAIEHVTRLCRVMVGKTIRQVCPPLSNTIHHCKLFKLFENEIAPSTFALSLTPSPPLPQLFLASTWLPCTTPWSQRHWKEVPC